MKTSYQYNQRASASHRLEHLSQLRENRFTRYQPTSTLRVAGILPDGRVSGRHYSIVKAKGLRPRIQLDTYRPSLCCGSGFDVSIPQDTIWAESTRRVLVRMSAQKQYWDVVFVHPERQIADHASLSTSPLIPPLPSCLAPVRNFLVEAGITPLHMSSDAGFSLTGGLPSSVFTLSQPKVSNCTACFVVACDKLDPGNSPPATAIIIEGIERIKLLNPFLGELIGGIAMSYIRSSFPNPIIADMDCAAVINLQDQQSHVPPERASDKKTLVWSPPPGVNSREGQPTTDQTWICSPGKIPTSDEDKTCPSNNSEIQMG
jgi:hypothetical protein